MIRYILLIAICLVSGSLGYADEAPEAPTHYDPTDTILVLGAVPQEIPPFIDAMPDAEKKSIWGVPYWQGHIHGKPVIVAITGIGKTYTATTSTLMIEAFRPRLVLMSGTGARINPDLRTGDVIVASTVSEHDYGSLTRDGMVFRNFNSPDDGAEVENAFSPPAAFLDLADKAMETYEPPNVTANGETYEIKVRRGIVSSSDLFGVTERRIDLLRNHFEADIMEMESGPLGHACIMLGVPFIVVRAASNEAQEAPNDDYLRLGPIASKQAAYFSLHLLEYL